jgi:heme exporter protein D
MDTTTLVTLIVLAVLVVGYVMRRKARLSRDDMD